MLESEQPVHDSVSYQQARHDVIRFLENPKSVLDVGCNRGGTGAQIKALFPNCIVDGIDYNAEAVIEADKVLDNAWQLDLTEMGKTAALLKDRKYDSILFLDVLEHLPCDNGMLALMAESLDEGGCMIISIPNIAFYTTFLHLLKLRFPRNQRGIYDVTHLRFFMKGNLSEFCPEGFGYEILHRNLRLKESPGGAVNKISKVFSPFPWVREFFTFQYIIKISK